MPSVLVLSPLPPSSAGKRAVASVVPGALATAIRSGLPADRSLSCSCSYQCNGVRVDRIGGERLRKCYVDISLPCVCHELHALLCDAEPPATHTSSIVLSVEVTACTILAAFHKAQAELVGRAVVLTDGKAGTVDDLWLDEIHGLRISIEGHEGKWPVSTIKFAQTD